jgi:hypothetical protein
MRKNTWVGWALFASASLLGCGSSNDVNTSGQLGTADASAGNSGSNGMSGNANAGGNGQSGSGQGANSQGANGQGANGTSGNPNAGGTGQSGSGQGANGQGATGTSGNPNAGGTGQGGTSGNANAGGAGGLVGPIVDGGGVTWGNTQCTDGIDNDGDGKADADDPECTGPLDNDEATYATGIPGDNRDPKWQDCFFDGNSGAGDDGCRYHTDCLSGDLPQTSPSCTLTQQCKDYCTRYTPNGCDCFGCCKVPLAGGGTASVQITATCTLADAGDPTKCPPCVQSTQCNNTCGRCELCVGKDTIPADCYPPPATGGAPNAGGNANAGGASGAGGVTTGGRTGAGGAGGTPAAGGAPSTGGAPPCPTPACAPGQQPCGVSCLPDCPSTDFCLTGCCIHAPA